MSERERGNELQDGVIERGIEETRENEVQDGMDGIR